MCVGFMVINIDSIHVLRADCVYSKYLKAPEVHMISAFLNVLSAASLRRAAGLAAASLRQAAGLAAASPHQAAGLAAASPHQAAGSVVAMLRQRGRTVTGMQMDALLQDV